MQILLIGNGFDLEHGLPTKLYDALVSIGIQKKHKSNLLKIAMELLDEEKLYKKIIYDSEEWDDFGYMGPTPCP